MSRERPEIRLLRESLEGSLEPTLAHAVLFEALENRGGDPPQTRAELEAWVEGDLASALEGRLGTALSRAALADARAVVAQIPEAPGRTRGDATANIPLDDAPVLVVVVSTSPSLAMRLSAAMGPERVTPTTARTQAELDARLATFTPALVLIDAADFASIEPSGLAAACAKLPKTTIRIVWGADLPFGGAVLRALSAANASPTPVDRREGFDPLLDLVRSRRRS